MKKRILGIALALCMVFSLIPAKAFTETVRAAEPVSGASITAGDFTLTTSEGVTLTEGKHLCLCTKRYL